MIDISATEETPRVVLNPIERYLIIEGRSFPQNSSEFYDPILSELQNVLNADKLSPFKIECILEYFNTSSQKYLSSIFKMVNALKVEGTDVSVVWMYYADDSDMKEIGEEFEKFLSIKFIYKSI